MKSITNEILYERLENHIRENHDSIKLLNEKIDLGFKGVYFRQDKTNGKLIDHDKYITDLQKEDIRLGNKVRISKVTWTIFTIMGSVIIALMVLILSKIKI